MDIDFRHMRQMVEDAVLKPLSETINDDNPLPHADGKAKFDKGSCHMFLSWDEDNHVCHVNTYYVGGCAIGKIVLTLVFGNLGGILLAPIMRNLVSGGFEERLGFIESLRIRELRCDICVHEITRYQIR